MKNKDTDWYEQKIRELKKDKKEQEKALKKSSFASTKDRKKIAEEAKRKKRAYKRAERQNWKKAIQNEIDSGDI